MDLAGGAKHRRRRKPAAKKKTVAKKKAGPRKHAGINQKTGRLKKGWRYAPKGHPGGRKLKNGLTKIIKAAAKPKKKVRGGR